MDISLLEKSFLTRCSNLTIASLAVVIIVVTAILPVMGQTEARAQLEVPQFAASTMQKGAGEFAVSSSEVCRNHTDQNTLSEKDQFNDNRPDRHRGLLVDGDLPFGLNVENVLMRKESASSMRLSVYLSNCTGRSGVVQMRSGIESLHDAGLKVGQRIGGWNGQHVGDRDANWQRRRVPRFDYLVYSVSVHRDTHPSNVQLFIRSNNLSVVRKLDLSGYWFSEETSFPPINELYTELSGDR